MSDTDIKKTNRWYRIGTQKGEIDQLLDLYWGGSERRITGMTLRIIGINTVSLVILLVGVFSMGQYQTKLIESKLDIFRTEIFLLAASYSEESLYKLSLVQQKAERDAIKRELELVTGKLSATLDKRIMLFDTRGDILVDSNTLNEKVFVNPLYKIENKTKLEKQADDYSLLSNLVLLIRFLIGTDENTQIFTEPENPTAWEYKDAFASLQKNPSASVWRTQEGRILLTAAVPLMKDNDLVGVVMLHSYGDDIDALLSDAWQDIFKIFFVTLLITIFISIYLSGVIARPLRKLARAAEDVRRGNATYADIPDLSHRLDEIGELSIVIRDMTHALWERMDMIESFAADVAHEIKNPLTSLKSAVETARIVKKKEDVEKLLDVIQHDVERLDRLITDISHASRLDAELSREMFEKVDIKRTLLNLLNVYKSPLDRNFQSVANYDEAQTNGVKIRLYLPEAEQVCVLGSESRLIQVFQNIIANALSFSPQGGSIYITLEHRLNRLSLFFEDEGAGIPENNLKTVFDRFYSERPQHEGFGRHSGLGLSICKQIITAHNGLIFAENRKDGQGRVRGARFVVILNAVS